jgi:hypothetical protein
MKSIFFLKVSITSTITLLALFPFGLNAQNGESNTLFGGSHGREIRLGGYGAFETKVTQLENRFGGVLLGGRGGVIINERFSIGGAGYWMPKIKELKTPIPNNPFPDNRSFYWTGGYGGLFLEYINSSKKLLHFTSSLLIGGAHIACEPREYPEGFESYPEFGSFLLEPGIGIELNVTQFFRINLGVNYRYAPNFKFEFHDYKIAEKSAFNGFSVNLTLKFGRFI